MSKKLSFEEAIDKLEETADSLEAEDVTLETAIKNYEKGLEYYEQCDNILKEAKQKIETYRKKG
ncbi:MAG: exodeoxyribonuclease VII small subunit [Eubacteriaceae bacterium]|nr:exodeoxyribonuclease VII small subunit [Eubacteriaceae bacterium]